MHLSARQSEVYQHIKDFISENQRPPTRVDIADHFNFSPNAAECHLRNLEKKGAIELSRAASRGIKVLGSRLSWLDE